VSANGHDAPPSSKKPLELWVCESNWDTHRASYRVKQVLFDVESPYQHVHIVETESFGRMLLNDSVVQISERDERVYHEMLVHVPMFTRPGIQRVLVIGGGDGGTVREVLRHESVTCCRLVEIDGAVIEGCRAHIPQTSAALADPRVEVVVADGVAHVEDAKRANEQFDLILVDSSDPVGPAVELFSTEFYTNVERILTDDGIVVTQANSPFYEPEAQRQLLEVLRPLFRRLHLYNYSNLTYAGGLWSFSWAGKGDSCPVRDLAPSRVADSGLDFHYYNAAIHRAAFVLPEFQSVALSDILTRSG
jgi:spermidine synthase